MKSFKHNSSSSFHKGNRTVKVGIISVTSKGAGYVKVEGFEDDFEVPQGYLNTALHRDEVEIALGPTIPNMRQAAEVVRVIKRAKEQFVGTIDKNGACYLIPDDRKMYTDIFLTGPETEKVNPGDKVLARITKWKDPKKNPEGIILRVIGKKGNNNVEMESIVLEKGFDTGFPPEVENEAEKLEKTEKPIKAEEITKRKDFRQTLTFTIDPADAKDFDDAISFKKISDDRFEIGVHIADVSHYVRIGTELDKEAQKRGFSVYLVDRTIPMLPEVLSNDICSLNPNEDKLTFSAVFEMNRNGEVLASWFGKTVINSDKRFTYEEAQETLEQGGKYFDELTTLNSIAKILQKEKWEKGAIDFEQDEVKFRLDENGKPIEVYRKVRKDAHKLVEEYMLLANRGVAEFLAKGYEKRGLKMAAMLYRIHDRPDPEKVHDLSIFLKALGYELESHGGKVSSKQIANVLRSIEGKPNESLVKTVAIRSMAKAIYSTLNVGHFGLAYDYYTHFTSPIRRYADLLVHRLLERFLAGGKIESGEISRYQKMAEASTEKEIAAAEAERASIKYKQVEYMQSRVGQIFDGVITGVTEWGVYIEELETKCEGMVRVRDLGDDFFSYDEASYSLVGEKTKKKFTLGDKIKFKVTKADLDAKTLDYLLV